MRLTQSWGSVVILLLQQPLGAGCEAPGIGQTGRFDVITVISAAAKTPGMSPRVAGDK